MFKGVNQECTSGAIVLRHENERTKVKIHVCEYKLTILLYLLIKNQASYFYENESILQEKH